MSRPSYRLAIALRRFGSRAAVSAAIMLGSIGAARANTCVWIGNGVGAGLAFSGVGNWSGCGGLTPQATDDVVFDTVAGTNQNCNVDIAVDVKSLTIQNNYTKTISPTGATSIRIRGDVTMTSAATLKLTSATTQIGGTFTRTSGSLNGNGGTTIFNATGAVTHTFSGSAAFNKVIINDGLVAYWNLDEGSGTSLADQSGYANGLTLSASSFTSTVPTAVTFSDPSAVAFSGSAYAHLTTTPPTNLPAANGAVTISAWLKLGSTATVQDAVALGDGGSNGVKLGIQSVGSLAAWTWGATPTTLASTLAPSDAAWHQVTFTYDGTNNRLYLDGALQSGATTVADLGSYDGTHELMAAGGAVDDVRVYNRALTGTEVSALALGDMPATGVATHTFSGALTATSDLVLASGAMAGAGSMSITGSWLNYGGSNTATGGVTLKAASGVILSGGQLLQENVAISAGATYTLSDRLWATNRTVTVTGGLSTGLYVAHIGTLAGVGSLSAGSGTVVLDNSFTTTAAGASFNNLRMEDSKSETNSVAYWKLDEGSGSKTYDLTGSANHGTLNGGVSWTAGASASVGYDDAAGVTFDGTTGYISTGVTNIPKPDAKQTISVWVKLASTSGTQDIVAFNDGAGDGIKLGLNAGTLSAWTWAGTSLITATTPVDGAWHSVIYSWDGTTNNLYVDGVAATSTVTAHPTGTITQGVLGSADGTQEFLNGSLDDVRVYKTALTATQVAQLAAGRYAGTGGYSTLTLGVATTVGGALTLDAGNLNANGNTVAATSASAVNAGTYTVGSAAQTFSGGLTVQPTGTITLASGTGCIAVGNGTTLTVDGTLNASAAGATITSVTGHYAFRIGTTVGATPTLNISGLTVQGTDSNGMWIGVNSSATVTTSEFDNIAFSNGTGTQLLKITSGTIYLGSSGCTFDGSTTYA